MPAKNEKKPAAATRKSAKASSTAKDSGKADPARRSRELSRPQLESLRAKLSRQYHGSR